MNQSDNSHNKEENKHVSVSNAELIALGLQVVGAVLSSFGDVFDLFKSEFNLFAEDPFDIKKRVAISEQRILYEHFGKNPLHAWMAIDICDTYKLEQRPQWADAVIFSSARSMISLGASDATINSGLKQAIGVDGHKVSQFQDNMFWLEVFHETHALIDKGVAQKTAFYKVSKKHRGKAGTDDTVEKHYFEFRSKLKDVPLPHPFDL